MRGNEASAPTAPVPGVVDLYRKALRADEEGLGELIPLLDTDERARAARFLSSADRARYIVATAFLREVLSAVVGAPPESLRFSWGRWGKPYLDDGPSFNLSHSRTWVLVGVAAHGRLGVDVEDVRPIAELDRLIASTLHSAEAAELLAAPRADRAAAFFRLWTRKEALTKAVGRGLHLSLASFRIGAGPETLQGIREWSSDLDLSGWSIRTVSWDEGTEAAVAWDRRDVPVRWRRCS